MTLSKRITTFSDGSYQVENFTPSTPFVQFYQHKEDEAVFGSVRPCGTTGGCPAVFVLREPTFKVSLDKHWQYYLIAINHRMTLENISAILDWRLAFANGTGLTKPDVPRRDYILGKNLLAMENGAPAYPKFDKDRTCSRSVLAGTEIGDNLLLRMFNGSDPPPMKTGKTHPQTIAAINIDDYLYNPKDHRWMFFAANVVASKPGGASSVAPFPRGAMYDWTGDNNNYTWLPHVSRHLIQYPLSKLIKLPTNSPTPSPYRVVRL